MSTSSLRSGRDSLLCLIAVAWADGNVDAAEAESIRQAARQLGLAGADIETIEQALRSPITLADVETVRMDRLARLFTYAAATRVAEVDGQLTKEEQKTLQLLGDRLGLSGTARARAVRALREVVTAGQDHELGYDLARLEAKLKNGLSQISDD